MLRRTIEWLFPRQAVVATAPDLREFLRSRAAFVSQKATYEYCRARAGVMWDKLMLERDFVTQLEHGRWQGFVAVLSDLAVIAELVLRPHADGRDLSAGLGQTVAAVASAEPQLGQSGVDVAGAIDAIRRRLGQVALVPPRKVYEIAAVSGGAIFALMPVHTSVRQHDEATITNNVRFLMIRVYEDLAAAVDGPQLAESLTRQSAGQPDQDV